MAGALTVDNLRLAFVLVMSLAIAYGAWRNRPKRGAAALAGFALTVAVLVSTHLVSHLGPALAGEATGAAIDRLAGKARWIGFGSLAFVWFAFVLDYTGRDHLLTRKGLAALFAWPALLNGLIWAPDVASLVGVDPGLDVYGALDQQGTLFWGHAVLSYGLIAVGTVLVVLHVRRTNQTFQKQGVALLSGLVAMWVGSVVSVFELFGDAHLHALQNGFVVMGVAFFWGVFRAGLTDITPVARTTILRNLSTGVFVVDSDGRITDSNPAARRTVLGTDGSVVGRPIADVLGEDSDVLAAIEDPGVGTERVTVDTDVGERVLNVDVTPVTERGDQVGKAVVMADVTELKRREQELELMKQVFSRVMRHNIRNDLTVVFGHAEFLAETDEQRRRDSANEILDKAVSIVEMADKARAVERAMEREDPVTNQEVTSLVRDLVAEFEAEYPSARFRTDLPDEQWVYAHVDLDLAVENALDNAVEHNDAPDPLVSVSVESRPGDRVEIRVEDDGPGIDSYEVSAVKRGIEDDLHHGSGVGLPLINWIATHSGGELEVEPTDDGTRVGIVVREGTAPHHESAGVRREGSPTRSERV